MAILLTHDLSGKPFSGAPVKVNGKPYTTTPSGTVSLKDYTGQKKLSLEINGVRHNLDLPGRLEGGTLVKVYNNKQRVAEVFSRKQQMS